MKLGEAMYKAQQGGGPEAGPGAGGPQGGAGAGKASGGAADGDGKVVDADFEEVDEKKGRTG
jgi:molecular chaperone DnaK